MDSNVSQAVTETFVRLYNEGLIYRAERVVDWSTALQTVLSKSELEDLEVRGRTLITVPGYDRTVEVGVIVYFNYPIDGSSETIPIATTRPETIPGDTGVAVHPQDQRYMHLIGKHVKHPFVDRLLPIVADESVDPNFGTGAVKITPAHDYEDEKRAKRHSLAFINILNDDGTLNVNAGTFAGEKRFDARHQIVEQLKKRDLFIREEDNPMTVSRVLEYMEQK
jgi:valyl-tRNA synthetase